MMSNEDKLPLIAYCGLYCPKCFKMKMASSAKDLLNEILSAQNHGATYLQNDPAILYTLDNLINLECTHFCREGGESSPTCPVKICCQERGLSGCWECSELDSCNKLKKQFQDNNQTLRELGIDEYIQQYD